MKKTISMLLACIMIFACVPITASAADLPALTGVETVNSNFTVASGDSQALNGTRTFTKDLIIEEGATFTVKSNSSVIVVGSGRLLNKGNIVVENGGMISLMGTGEGYDTGATLQNASTGVISVAASGTLQLGQGSMGANAGTITGKASTSVVYNGTMYQKVIVPGDFSVTYPGTDTWNRTDDTVNYKVYYLLDSDGLSSTGSPIDHASSDLSYIVSTKTTTDTHGVTTTKWEMSDEYKAVGASDASVYVQNGTKLYVAILPDDPAGASRFVDHTRLKIVAGGQTVSNDRGVFEIVPANAISITPDSSIYKYKNIVRIYTIELPRTDGYYVVSKDGDVDSCTVEFGKTFSFRITLSPEYDKSDYSAYVNTMQLQPDEFGYFDVTGKLDEKNETMATAGGVQDEIRITVMGVVSNEMQSTISDVISFIKQIFEVIKSLFEDIFGAFSGLKQG